MGQPVSGNAAKAIGRGYRRSGGVTIAYPKLVSTEALKAYQQAAALVIGSAIPSGWRWSGRQLVVEYRFWFDRPMDATNAIKTIEDALSAKLGVDDKWYLPRTMTLEWGVKPSEARVELTVIDG